MDLVILLGFILNIFGLGSFSPVYRIFLILGRGKRKGGLILLKGGEK
jgi:hypothetical protein